MLLCQCASDRRDCLGDHLPIGIALDLLDDRQPFLAVGLEREGGGAEGAKRGVRPFCRPFDVLRIDVSATQDDHVLEPASDEQHAIPQKTKIACPEEPQIAKKTGSQRVLRLFGSPPVALRDARARNPDLADAIFRTLKDGFGVDDHHAMSVGDLAAARESLAGAGKCRFDDFTATEAFGVNRQRRWRLARRSARNQQCRLGETVAGQK